MNRRTLFAALTSVAVLLVAAGATRRRLRLSEPPDPHHRAAGGRFRGGPPGARSRAEEGELWGQQRHRGESPGRQRDHRNGAGAKAAPMVHADLCSGEPTDWNPFIYKKLSYDPLRDFAPITQTSPPDGRGGQSARDSSRSRMFVARARQIRSSSTTVRSASVN